MKFNCLECGKNLKIKTLPNPKTFHSECNDCNILWVIRKEGRYKPS